MGWAENRISEYHRGSPSTWLERRSLEHANPWHFLLGLVALALFIVGLWVHDIRLIAGALLLSFLGHLYCWTRMVTTTHTGREVTSQELANLKHG